MSKDTEIQFVGKLISIVYLYIDNQWIEGQKVTLLK